MSPRRWLAAVTALAVAQACTVALAVASPPRPVDLRVAGGEGAWHSTNSFTLEWADPPAGEPPLVALAYRIRNPQGTAIDENRIDRVSGGISGLRLPGVPGAYTAEVWFEDAAGERGPAAVAKLRFDDVRPASIEPLPIPGWIGRTAFPLRVRLGHPPGPPPLSGIGGYAVAIDVTSGGAPCAAADRCSAAETTLGGGVEDDTLTIAGLPEGISYLSAVAVSGSGMKSASSGRAVLRVDLTDPITQLTGVPPGWTNRAVRLTAHAVDAGSGMELDGGGPHPFTAIRVDGGAPTIAPGGTANVSVIDEGIHRIACYARDAAGNVDDGGIGNGAANRPPRTAWVRIDRGPPSVAFANSQDPRDPDLLRVRIADSLSAPDLARGRISVRPLGSDERFESLPPAPPARGELRARWDSDAQPVGEYEFRAVGYDAAGNSAVTTRRGNGTPMVLSNPLKATTTIEAALGDHSLRRTVRYGRGVGISGRLIAGIRSPLAGMPVRIVEHFAAGARPAMRISTATTGPKGLFSIRSAPGPSRTIEIGFGGSPTLAHSSAPTLEVKVRSRVRLRASSAFARVGGPPLVFRGRVEAPPGTIPDQGKAVQLQFRLPGLPWTEFRTIETDRHGRFRYAYRFSDDDSRGTRFQFRAYAPTQDDWPYEPGGSQPVIVRGR